MAKDHYENGDLRKRGDLRMIDRPTGFEHVHDERVAGLLASGFYIEMPDGNTPLPDETA